MSSPVTASPYREFRRFFVGANWLQKFWKNSRSFIVNIYTSMNSFRIFKLNGHLLTSQTCFFRFYILPIANRFQKFWKNSQKYIYLPWITLNFFRIFGVIVRPRKICEIPDRVMRWLAITFQWPRRLQGKFPKTESQRTKYPRDKIPERQNLRGQNPRF